MSIEDDMRRGAVEGEALLTATLAEDRAAALSVLGEMECPAMAAMALAAIAKGAIVMLCEVMSNVTGAPKDPQELWRSFLLSEATRDVNGPGEA